MPAAVAEAHVSAPAWTRPLHSTPAQADTVIPVMQPLPNGTLLVRNGRDMLVIDDRGVTRWSMPNIDDALVDGDMVVFRRSHLVFAVRARDAGMLWKRPCERPPYLAAAGERIVTMCDGLSTVLRGRDGSVLARHVVKTVTGPPMFQHGARTLNDCVHHGDDLLRRRMDGGNRDYVVDAHTGASPVAENGFRRQGRDVGEGLVPVRAARGDANDALHSLRSARRTGVSRCVRPSVPA